MISLCIYDFYQEEIMFVEKSINSVRHLLLGTTVFFLFSVGLAQNADMQHSINVTGQGIVYAQPDTATVTLGISTIKPDVDEAVNEANKIIAEVLKILNDLGVEDKDVKTGQFNIYPQQEYTRNGSPSDVVNYSVNHSLTISVRDTDKVGKILTQSIGAGANTSNNVIYSLSDLEEVQEKARAKAVASVQKKAQQLADLTNVTLGKVLRIDETSGYFNGNPSGFPGPIGPVGPIGPMGAFGPAGLSMATANSAGVPQMQVPVSAGQIAVQVNLYVIYAIE